jgi:hypothetical protein
MEKIMSLENVQPGDTLIIHGLRTPRLFTTVNRLTKTQIVIDNGSKFRRSNGRLIGADIWSSSSVEVPKPGECDEIRQNQLQRRLVSWVDDACQINLLRGMSVEKLQQLTTVLEKP